MRYLFAFQCDGGACRATSYHIICMPVLCFYSPLAHRWRRIDFPVTAPVPAPRSGHQMAVYSVGEQIFLYGGYSKVVRSANGSLEISCYHAVLVSWRSGRDGRRVSYCVWRPVVLCARKMMRKKEARTVRYYVRIGGRRMTFSACFFFFLTSYFEVLLMDSVLLVVWCCWFMHLVIVSPRVLSAVPPLPNPHPQPNLHHGPPTTISVILGSRSQEKEPGQKKEGKTHNDMWVLNMKAAVSGGNPTWDRVRFPVLVVHIILLVDTPSTLHHRRVDDGLFYVRSFVRYQTAVVHSLVRFQFFFCLVRGIRSIWRWRAVDCSPSFGC